MSRPLEEQILDQARESIGNAIKAELVGYNKPLSKLTEQVVEEHKPELRKIFDAAMVKAINGDEFKTLVEDAFQHKLAKALVASFSGTVDKAFNAMKNDPTIKAKAILAIEKIIMDV